MFDSIYNIVLYVLAFIGLIFIILVIAVGKYLKEQSYNQVQIKKMTTEAELFQFNKDK